MISKSGKNLNLLFGCFSNFVGVEHGAFYAVFCSISFILICDSSLHVFSFHLLLHVSIQKAYRQSSSILADQWLDELHSAVSVCSSFSPLLNSIENKKKVYEHKILSFTTASYSQKRER